MCIGRASNRVRFHCRIVRVITQRLRLGRAGAASALALELATARLRLRLKCVEVVRDRQARETAGWRAIGTVRLEHFVSRARG